MAKEFDVVILGASGFTGQFVVEEMARNATLENIKWAVAGRSLHKVQQTLVRVQNRVSDNLKGVKIFETDVTDQTSLENMTKNTKLVINCVGPYEKYGEPVVAACLKHKTHLIDMTVEVPFMNRMMLKYYHEAESNGVYIVSACGFGYLYFEMAIPVLEQKFEGGIESIDVYVKPVLKPGSVHFGTWESIVNMGGSFKEILLTRQQIYSKILNQTRSRWSILSPTSPVRRSKEVKGLSFKVPSILMTGDLGLEMKARAFNEKPIKMNSYISAESTTALLLSAFVVLILMCLLPFSFGRWLLTKYPEILGCGYITKADLTDKNVDTSGGDFIKVARGWSRKQSDGQAAGKPDKTVVLHGSGPTAYRSTGICLVQSALTVLQETDRLPNSGGVYTPIAAFSKTSLPTRLQKHGISYTEK